MRDDIKNTWKTKAIDEFLEEIYLGKSLLTAKAYEADIRAFLSFIEYRGIKSLQKITAGHITAYLAHCKRAGKSTATVRRHFQSLRVFCAHLRRTKKITENLIEFIKVGAPTHTSTRVLTRKDVMALLAQPDVDTETGVRDRAILELLYSSGLRAAELCDLQVTDVTPTQVKVTCGKGGKTRSVPLTTQAWRWIELYLETYRSAEPGPLFLTNRGGKVNPVSLCMTVKKYAEKANLQGVSTHTLRHCCATHLMDGGGDVRFIQEVLGHASILSTQRYTHLSSAKMQEKFNNFHPRGEHEPDSENEGL